MKKKMPSKQALRALYQTDEAAFARRIQGTLSALPEIKTEEMKMKKKWSLALVIALAIMLLAGAALALTGGQVFEFFANLYGDSSMGQMLSAIEQKSVQQTQSFPVGSGMFTLTQSYYDGEELYLSYSLTGADELYLGDGMYLSGTDVYLDLSTSDDKTGDNITVGYRIFQTPLPDEARNQDTLTLDAVIYHGGGKDKYTVPVTIARSSQSSVTTLPFSGKIGAFDVTGQLEILPIYARLTVTAKSTDGSIVSRDDFETDDLSDFTLYANGTKAAVFSGEGEGFDTASLTITHGFMLPADMSGITSLTVVPVYYQSGEKEAEALAVETEK